MDAPSGELTLLAVFATFRVIGVVDGKRQNGLRMCLCVPCVVGVFSSFRHIGCRGDLNARQAG